MKNTINLTKIYFKETLNNHLNRSNSNKSSLTKNILSFLAIFLLVAVCIGYSLYGTASGLKQLIGDASGVIILGLIISLVMVIMLTVFDAQGYFYKSKDYELLQSLPIKTTGIITAKYLSSYIVSFVYNLMIALPTFVVYFIFEQVTFASIIFAIIGVVLLPAYSQLIGSLLAWVVNIISSKFKNKNIIRNVLSIAFLILIFVFIYTADTSMIITFSPADSPLAIKILFPQIYFLSNAVASDSIVMLLAFVGISILFAIVSVLVVSISYKKINSALNSNIRSKRKKEIKYKKSSILNTLMKKETKNFFCSPVYLTNGIVGPILLIVMAIMMSTMFADLMEGQINDLAIIIMSIFAMCIGMVPTTSVSISIEGSKFFTTKSLPIKYESIILSKLLFNIVLFLPFLLVAEIISWALLPFDFVVHVMVFLYLMFGLTFFASIGLLINIRMPKLNWSSETQAIKQGASTFTTMFLNLFISFIPMIVYFILSALSITVNVYLYILIFTVLMVVLNIVSFSLLFTKGREIFNKIQN